MKAKTFILLCVVFCALAAAAFVTLRGDRSGEQSRMGERLFSDLPIETITRIDVAGPQAAVHLQKGPSVWVVENRYGYPADFDAIAELVKKIRDLKVGRVFKADNAVRQRLALLDPQSASEAAEDRRGTRVVLTSDNGAPPVADLLIGEARQGGGVSGGHHIIRMDPGSDDVVYLVDQSFRSLRADPDDWLAKDLVSVEPEEVREVACYELGGEKLIYRLVRAEKGGTPHLEGATEKDSVDSAKVERVFGALSALTLDGVAGPRDAVDFSGLDNPRRFEYRLFDGSVYILQTATGTQSGDGGGQHYLSIATAYEPPQAAGVDPDGEESEVKAEAGPAAAPDAKGKMARLDERLRPWAFTISTWKYEGLVYDRRGLLQQKD
jgi:hypothetical protein